MHIRHLIQLFTSVWLLIVLIIVNISIYFLFHHMTIRNELERVSQNVEEIAQNIQPNIEESERSAMLRAFLPADGMIRIVNENGEALVSVVKNPEIANLPPVFERSQKTIRKDEFAIAQHPIIWDNGEVATLEMIESLEPALANLQLLKIVLFIATIIVFIPSIFSGRFLSEMILRPINAMIRTMEEIQQKGAFKKIVIKHKPKDELYQMANTFNSMIAILEKNFAKQEQFVSDASHELKTPLTIIDSYANMLKRWGKERPELLNEAIETIQSEAERMKTLAEQLLLLAKNEENWNMEMSKLDLFEVCKETGSLFQKAYEREVHVKSLTHAAPFVYADKDKIKQLLFILLDNAKKYSSEPIHICVGEEIEECYFIVEDKGIGIPKDAHPHLFDRFYRVDEARNRDHGGSGLGLAIAKKIVDAHRGAIAIESEEGKGTKVKVWLPRAER